MPADLGAGIKNKIQRTENMPRAKHKNSGTRQDKRRSSGRGVWYDRIIQHLGEHKSIIIILGFVAALKVVLSFMFPAILWDEAVYDGMAKFLYSGGLEGFLEIVRPIGLPLLTGGLWKLGIDVVVASRIVVAILHLGVILLTYFLTKMFFGKRSAIIAAAILSINPLMLYWGTKGYSTIPATFFVLLGIYAYLHDKHIVAGISFGMSFLTRFPLAFLIAPFMIYVIWRDLKVWRHNRPLRWGAIKTVAALSVVGSAYLLFNKTCFGNCFAPFIQGFMSRNWGSNSAIFTPDLLIYVKTVAGVANVSLIFVVLGLATVLKGRSRTRWDIIGALILPALFFAVFHHWFGLREERYILPVFPVLAIFAGVGLARLRMRTIVLWVSIMALLSSSILAFSYFHVQAMDTQVSEEFYIRGNAAINAACPTTKPIAASNPLAVLRGGRTYFYYGNHSDEYITIRFNKIHCFFFNTCDFAGSVPPAPLHNKTYPVYRDESGYCKFYVYKNRNVTDVTDSEVIIK